MLEAPVSLGPANDAPTVAVHHPAAAFPVPARLPMEQVVHRFSDAIGRDPSALPAGSILVRETGGKSSTNDGGLE